jgi:hypothetical protein
LKMQPKATQSIENAAPPKGPPKMMKNDWDTMNNSNVIPIVTHVTQKYMLSSNTKIY